MMKGGCFFTGRIAYGSDMSPQVVSDRLIPPFKISNLTLKLEDIPQFFSRSVVKDSDRK